MRKKFLSCIVAVIMLAGMAVMPVSADNTVYDGDFAVDLAGYTDISGASYSAGGVTISKTSGYAAYEVYVAEDASYYLNSTMNASGIIFTVNGESVSRRCGRTKIDGTGGYNDWIMLDEVQLKAGEKNTVKIHGVTGTVSALSFTKLDNKQYTTSMNTYAGGRTFDDTNIAIIGVDPWLPMNATFAAIPKDSNAPYVTFDVTIPESGYYYPAVAKGTGGSNVKFTINNEEVLINENCTTEAEILGFTNQNARWLRYNESIYLEAGTYPLKLSLYLPANSTATSWNTNIGAVRFYHDPDGGSSGDDPDDDYEPVKVYDGDISFDLSGYSSSQNITEENGTVHMKSGSVIEFEVNVSEYAAYYVNYKSSNEGEGTFYIDVSANGKTVNTRTGSTSNSVGGTVFQDEIHLNEGKNTITVSTRGANSGYLSELWLQKLENMQFTTSMHAADNSQTIKYTNRKPEKGSENPYAADPWMYIYSTTANYPPHDSPYVTFDAAIGQEGYYYVELARGSGSYAVMYVDGQCFDMNKDASDTGEKYISSSNASASCSWKRSKNVVFLSAGMHEVTIKAVGSAYTSSDEGDRWRLPIGAVRFIQSPKQHMSVTVEAEDAKIFVGESAAAYQYDSDDIAVLPAPKEDAALVSGSAMLSIKAPVTNAPIRLEYELVVKKEGDYKIGIMKAHDNEEYSEGKISVITQYGDTLIDNIVPDDSNAVLTSSAGLDISELKDSIHLPAGKHKLIYTFSGDDTDAVGENINALLDAFVFTELFDSEGVTAVLGSNSVCLGQRINVDFINKNGDPVYLNALSSVSFDTADKSIAEVSAEGVVKGIKMGSTSIIVNVNGKRFDLPVYVTASNGLIVSSAKLDESGNVDITYTAKNGAKFDIVVANYELINGVKSSVRGIFGATVTSDGTQKTEKIINTGDAAELGPVYEIYMWEKENNMVPVYGKIQIK